MSYDSPAVEIKAFLDALNTLGTIKVGSMDATPDELGAIYEYGGLPTEGRFGVQGVGYEKPSIQVMFRGLPGDRGGPMVKCRIAWRALCAVQPGTIISGGSTFLRIDPQQSPFELPKDLNQRFEIACNFYVTKEP